MGNPTIILERFLNSDVLSSRFAKDMKSKVVLVHITKLNARRGICY
jgi:hypothetical protein